MATVPKVILIGGASHVGKSTTAASLATSLGWKHISTDSLARHPGRPWKSAPEKVPDEVAEHYLSLSVDELIEDVLHHYRVNVWPQVKAIIASHLNDPSAARPLQNYRHSRVGERFSGRNVHPEMPGERLQSGAGRLSPINSALGHQWEGCFHASGLVLEGSALWPEFITSLDFEMIGAIWLVAGDELFRQRIHAESRYNSKSPREQMMIHKFLERTIAFNALMVDAANRHGLTLLDVQHSNVSELAEKCLSTLSGTDQP